jgi:peptide/nickel transport system permease protein
MLRYIAKRLLIFIPTLIAISLITFIISINAPGDPVESMLNKNGGDEGQLSQKQAEENAYNELRHRLGFDLPVFYFSFSNATFCDTLYKISNANHRTTLEHIAFNFGNWKNVVRYYSSLKTFESELYHLPKNDSLSTFAATAKDYVNTLYNEYESKQISLTIADMGHLFEKNEFMKPAFDSYVKLKISFTELVNDQSTYKRYIPVFHWYGFNNQYHRWLFGNAPWFGEMQYGQSKGFIRGDFGISYQDKRPVSTVLWNAMGWTMSLSILSMIFAYIIAIPLGVISAVDKGSLKEKSITTSLFMLYSLPNFWIATLAVIFLCGGDWLAWFPSPGADAPATDAPFSEWFSATVYRLVLPLVCWTYGSLAFISRQMRGGMLNVLGQDFIRTARAKGLNEKQVVWKHAFRNSLIPIITLFANVFPLAIAGSFVIEYIFSIPGMGQLSLNALTARNYPVIFTVMMFTAILTLIGNLVADILYALVDPRISFTKKES